MAGTTHTVERAYRSVYSGQDVLIKGYIPKTTPISQIDQRAETNIQLHAGLGDLVAWGIDSKSTGDNPRYMVVIKDDAKYLSTSSATAKLGPGGKERVIALRSTAINNMMSQYRIKS
jgi:hypothetical protein